ncbi:MAG: NADP-dependent phosphogluconate dehydrogenase [Planctomycetota bacterium]|jgi:6-phosphogluconate dehydrogenase
MSETGETRAAFGVWGLGTMGSNLALNVADKGVRTALWNRSPEKAAALASEHPELPFVACPTPEEFVAAIAPPRRVLLMVPAGRATDKSIETLLPLLAEGDVLVDGGNARWQDTERRQAELQSRGVELVGCGVSGGEDGARHGPSLMPGGSTAAWEALRPVFEAIAARTESGPCVAHMGPGGAGHFVKMVHNGIEYGVMQCIAETWDMARRAAGLDTAQTAEVFATWNKGPLRSFLVELTARVLAVRDEASGQALVELVSDRAAQKGTGRWTVEAALELGVPVPTIAAAVDARVVSADAQARQRAAGILHGPRAAPPTVARPPGEPLDATIDALHDALHAGVLCAYAQGLTLARRASLAHDWDLKIDELARIWTGGCIIRADLLHAAREAYACEPTLENMLFVPIFADPLREVQPRWRATLAAATARGIPTPALSASLAWYDAIRSPVLPQSLVQAQRDAFGAHGFRRTDRALAGPQHDDWTPPA